MEHIYKHLKVDGEEKVDIYFLNSLTNVLYDNVISLSILFHGKYTHFTRGKAVL